MNSGDELPVRRSRRVMNLLWLIVGGVLVVELAWLVPAQLQVRRHNTESVSISSSGSRKMPSGWFATASGTRPSPTGRGQILSFVVIEGPMSEEVGKTAGAERVSFNAGREPIVWLHVTRARRIQANVRPARVFYVQGDQVESVALPLDMTDAEFAQWSRGLPYEGVAAFKRWAAQK